MMVGQHGVASTPERLVTPQDRMQRTQRILSVDVLRGLCVAAMVLVNFPADWTLRYSQLAHAEWNGATATDIIFPAFLLLSGFSMVYSFAARLGRGQSRAQLAVHVVWRSVALLGLGLLLNALPSFNWEHLHVFGVLQRISLCYIVGGLLVAATAKTRPVFAVRLGAVVAAMLLVLLGVWAAERFVPAPGYGSWRFDHEGNLGAVLDRAVFGNAHLSDWGGPQRMWDADGLLSSFTSVPNLLLGVLAAVWVRRGGPVPRLAGGMALAGAVLAGLALTLNPYLVINRKLWTPSFALLSGGLSLLCLALVYLLVDGSPWLQGDEPSRARRRRWLTPALVYGSNATLSFVLYSVLLVVHAGFPLHGSHQPAYWLPGAAYRWMSGWMGPYNTSLLYALAAVLLVMLPLWPLYRRRIFLAL